MAIQNRRGQYADFDPSKAVAGELLTVLNGDPKAKDGKAVYMAFASGDVKRLATYEDMLDNIENASEEIAEQITEEVETEVADSVQTAQTAATTATTKASEAAASAASVSASASQIATNTSDISDLKSALTYKADNVYGGTSTGTPQTLTAGKTWHSTLGTLVNSANRAASDPIEIKPDMKSLAIASGFVFMVYGNNLGIGNALTLVRGFLTSEFAIDDNVNYKYLFIIVGKSNNQDISQEEVANVLTLNKYDNPLPYALEQDLDDINNSIDDVVVNISDIESNIGIHHLILAEHNLVNKDVRSTGDINVDNTKRVTNVEKTPIWANVPLYINKATGYFNPILYLFKNNSLVNTVTHFVNGNSYDADEVRFLFFKNPNTNDITPEEVVDNFSIYQERTTSYNKRIYDLEHTDEETNDYSLIAYGDSLTTGAGATSSNKTYWAVCASQLSMRNRIGFGFGGSQSKAIAWTAGALSAYIPPNLNTFALKYADLISNVSIAANALSGKTVIVDGAEYVITQTGVNEYSLPNTYTPSDVYLPIVNKNSRYTADIYVIWMGTNDNGMQWDLIDAMIAKLPHKKYIVMGLTRLGTDTSLEDEEKGYRLYGSHYFNTRMQIINNAFAVLGTTPTAEDETAMSNGLMPPSLLVDGLHFNDDGYEAIGKLLALHIKSLGYAFQIA